MELTEAQLEKLCLETLETHGIMTYKPTKFSDRKHASRKIDLGAPDLWCFRNGLAIAIELKTQAGRQSDAQKSFQDRLRANKVNYYIVRSVDDVMNVLKVIKSL